MISSPKRLGGLGFRNFQAFNLALLAKQGWRIMNNPNSLCAAVLKGIYFPSVSFMEASKGYRASWSWASLIKGQKVLKSGTHW